MDTDKFLCYISLGGLTLFIVVNIAFCIDSYYVKNNGFVEYTLNLHYIDGKSEIKTYTVESREYPMIVSGRGGYCIQVGTNRVWGVIRFDILSYNKIQDTSQPSREFVCHVLTIVICLIFGGIIFYNIIWKNRIQFDK